MASEGLKAHELRALEEKFGKNEFLVRRGANILRTGWDIVREPMFLILLLACLLYFLSARPATAFSCWRPSSL